MVPQLRFLPEDAGDVKGQLAPLLPGGQPKHLCPARSRMKDTSQHFNGCAFARAVWSNEGEHLTWLKRETYLLDGCAFAITGRDKRAETAHESGGPFAASKGLA